MEKMKELEQLAKPLQEFIKSNHHLHTAVVITEERVMVVETVTSIPTGCTD